jgi:hypothetical protein
MCNKLIKLLIFHTIIIAFAIPGIPAEKKRYYIDDFRPIYKEKTDSQIFPDELKILWQGGYGKEEAKEIQKNCSYEKITMKRTACYGTCPVYTATLSVNGKAKYEGIKHVERIGKYSGELFLIEYGKLCYLIDEYLKNRKYLYFRAPWTCSSACIITLELKDSTTLEIYDYGQYGLIELWAIQHTIDALIEKVEWK